MPSLAVSTDRPDQVSADVLVLAVAAPDQPGGDPELLGDVARPRAGRARRRGGAARPRGDGRPDAVVRVPVAGRGCARWWRSPASATGTRARPRDAAPRGRRRGPRARGGPRAAAFALPVADGTACAAVAEGALLGAYAFERYRVRPQPADRPPLERAVGRGVRTAGRRRATRSVPPGRSASPTAVALARDLGEHPAVGPATRPSFAEPRPPQPPAACRSRSTCSTSRRSRDGGYGGILGVGKGSAAPAAAGPARPTPPQGARGHLALVGKGITFDSGGLSHQAGRRAWRR